MSGDGLIHKKMVEVMRKITPIAKAERNEMQWFNFRGIDTVYNALHDIMADVGMYCTTEVLDDKSEERKSRQGGVLIYRILKIRYTFFTEDGSSVQSVVIGEGMDSGDKASNKAMAIAHKYALLQAFMIPTKEQKDPDADSPEVAPKEEKKTSKPRQQTKSKPKQDATQTGDSPGDFVWKGGKHEGKRIADTPLDYLHWKRNKGNPRYDDTKAVIAYLEILEGAQREHVQCDVGDEPPYQDMPLPDDDGMPF